MMLNCGMPKKRAQLIYEQEQQLLIKEQVEIQILMLKERRGRLVEEQERDDEQRQRELSERRLRAELDELGGRRVGRYSVTVRDQL